MSKGLKEVKEEVKKIHREREQAERTATAGFLTCGVHPALTFIIWGLVRNLHFQVHQKIWWGPAIPLQALLMFPKI